MDMNIVYFQGFQMSTTLTDVQKSELKAYMSLIGNTLVNSELYLAWVDHAIANEVIIEQARGVFR